MKKLMREMFQPEGSKLQLKCGVEIDFRRRKISEGDGWRAADYTSTYVQIWGVVFYAHFFFEYARRGVLTPRPALSVNIYYGLGSDSGPESPIKRHKYLKLWSKKA